MDRSEEALVAYDKSLELCLNEANEMDPSTWNRKGNALMELSRFHEAVNCYDEALTLDPENDIILSNKGLPSLNLGALMRPLKSLEKR